MHYKGINYDVGTKTINGGITRDMFDLSIVNKEIEIIKSELHCNAIRISGLSIERIVQAAESALKQGITVWFSPALHYDNPGNTLYYIVQGAAAAEKLRQKYGHVIFVAGCELSLFTTGFIPGDSAEQRTKALFSPVSLLKNILGLKRRYNKRLNTFLLQAVTEVRKYFKGQITYASGTWEKVNWNIFDIVSVDYYRGLYNKAVYEKGLQITGIIRRQVIIF